MAPDPELPPLEFQESDVPESDFERALLRGRAPGYAICVKPLRFAVLTEIVETFAEAGDNNRYYVFELEEDANRYLQEIPAERQLGILFRVRAVSHLAEFGPNDGPKLDVCGHPFAMRAFTVDRDGVVKEWKHPGRFGWRANATPLAYPSPARPTFMQRMTGRIRALLLD